MEGRTLEIKKHNRSRRRKERGIVGRIEKKIQSVVKQQNAPERGEEESPGNVSKNESIIKEQKTVHRQPRKIRRNHQTNKEEQERRQQKEDDGQSKT